MPFSAQLNPLTISGHLHIDTVSNASIRPQGQRTLTEYQLKRRGKDLISCLSVSTRSMLRALHTHHGRLYGVCISSLGSKIRRTPS